MTYAEVCTILIKTTLYRLSGTGKRHWFKVGRTELLFFSYFFVNSKVLVQILTCVRFRVAFYSS